MDARATLRNSGQAISRLSDWLTWRAQQCPDAFAIVDKTRSITYGELDEASNRLARALRQSGCGRGDRVTLLLPKSIEALIGMLGTLKADSVYVPMDTSSPAARLERILRVSESRFVLAQQATARLLDEVIDNKDFAGSIRVGWMDCGSSLQSGLSTAFNWGDVSGLSGRAVDSQTRESDAAHILFTSGSTGLPKGVVITHSNVIHFVEWANRCFGMVSTDRISLHPPLHFDLSTFDIYGSIAAGAELHLVPAELNLTPHSLAAFIRDRKLTQWFSVPSVLNYMARFDVIQWNDFPELKRLLWCGEKFPTPPLVHWMQRLPHVEFVNLYGPTEATIASSYYRVPSCPESDTAEIPIGEACEGEQLLVLDENLQPVAPLEVGDLYIGGVGLSPGYWNDPEKTAGVFLKNPNGGRAGAPERIYKTGDLARVGEDGATYLLGRLDSQIKSRGYRIELGEIETAIHAAPGVQDAAVVAVDSDGFEGAAICCAYVPVAGSGLSTLSLKEHLSKVLPKYMLPADWMAVEHMPRNANGKADRRLLREQFLNRRVESKTNELREVDTPRPRITA